MFAKLAFAATLAATAAASTADTKPPTECVHDLEVQQTAACQESITAFSIECINYLNFDPSNPVMYTDVICEHVLGTISAQQQGTVVMQKAPVLNLLKQPVAQAESGFSWSSAAVGAAVGAVGTFAAFSVMNKKVQ